MTSFYPFHRWISDTGAQTHVVAFGGWWDADAGGGGVTATPFYYQHLLAGAG